MYIYISTTNYIPNFFNSVVPSQMSIHIYNNSYTYNKWYTHRSCEHIIEPLGTADIGGSQVDDKEGITPFPLVQFYFISTPFFFIFSLTKCLHVILDMILFFTLYIRICICKINRTWGVSLNKSIPT